MANMSYCRFENTFSDFYDCYRTVQDAYNLREMKLSKSEYEYMLSLAEMARRFADTVEELENSKVDELTA